MVKHSTLTVMVLWLLIVSCSSMRTAEQTCSIQPPSDIQSDKKAAFEAAADLKAFAYAPISANVKSEVSRTFHATFQKVSDTVAACAMLNQTYVCIEDKERSSEFLAFMRESKQCTK